MNREKCQVCPSKGVTAVYCNLFLTKIIIKDMLVNKPLLEKKFLKTQKDIINIGQKISEHAQRIRFKKYAPVNKVIQSGYIK